MATDEPPYLTIGTDVSAKYKGAFCEAKIKKANRVVKCKVNFKNNLGTFMVTDDQIKGHLRVGAEVEAKHPEKNQFMEAVINKLQDYSQYTVVFDDGDETTLRRTSLCLKSGRHFAESPTLDQFPLTNPEHFSSPVIGTSKFKRKRRSTMNSSLDFESSDDESVPRKVKAVREKEHNPDVGRVVCVDFGDRRKKENWYPGLIMPAHSTTKTLKEEHLVRSFKDGKYYQVPKRDTRDFNRESIQKVDNNALRSAVEKAVNYLEKDELPPHWEKALFACLDAQSGDEDSGESDSDTSDDEPSEEKDRFVAQLYKFMDERGTPINKAPTVSNRDLNLYKLFKLMHKLGGYNKVTNKNKWKAVYMKMGLPASNQNGPNQIKFAYKRFLQSFEDFYRKLGCTMVSNSRSTRGRHRSDRNFIVTRTRDRESPKGRKNSKEPKEKVVPEKKSEEKPKAAAAEKKEPKPEETPKAEEKVQKTPEKKRPQETDKRTKKEEGTKPRLVRSQSLTKRDSPKANPEKARTREDARKEKNESPEKKGTRSSAKKEEAAAAAPKAAAAEVAPKAVDKTPRKAAAVKAAKRTEDKSSPKRKVERPARKEEAAKKPPVEEEEEAVLCKVEAEPEEEPKKEEVEQVKVEEPVPEEVKVEEVKEVPPVEERTPPGRPRGEEEEEEPPNKGKRRLLKMDDKDDKESLCGMSDSDDGSFTADPEKPDREVEVGDRVKVKYGRGRLQKVYEAKVLKVEPDGTEKKFYVHYAGWNTRYDEWVRKSYIVATIKQKDGVKSSSPTSLKKVDRGRPPGVFANTRPDRKNSTGSLPPPRTTRSEKKGRESKRRPCRKSDSEGELSDPSCKEELFSDEEEVKMEEEEVKITELEKEIAGEEVGKPPTLLAGPMELEQEVEDPPPKEPEAEEEAVAVALKTEPPEVAKEAPDLSLTSSNSVPGVRAAPEPALSFAGLIRKVEEEEEEEVDGFEAKLPVFEEDEVRSESGSKEKFDSKSISSLFDSILKQQPPPDSEPKTDSVLQSSSSEKPDDDRATTPPPKDHFDLLLLEQHQQQEEEEEEEGAPGSPKGSDSKDDIFSFTFSPHNASKDTAVGGPPQSEDSNKPSEAVDVSKMIPGILERLKKDVVSESPPPPKEEQLHFDFLRGGSQGVSKCLSRSDSSNSLRICESDTNDSVVAGDEPDKVEEAVPEEPKQQEEEPVVVEEVEQQEEEEQQPPILPEEEAPVVSVVQEAQVRPDDVCAVVVANDTESSPSLVDLSDAAAMLPSVKEEPLQKEEAVKEEEERGASPAAAEAILLEESKAEEEVVVKKEAEEEEVDRLVPFQEEVADLDSTLTAEEEEEKPTAAEVAAAAAAAEEGEGEEEEAASTRKEVKRKKLGKKMAKKVELGGEEAAKAKLKAKKRLKCASSQEAADLKGKSKKMKKSKNKKRFLRHEEGGGGGEAHLKKSDEDHADKMKRRDKKRSGDKKDPTKTKKSKKNRDKKDPTKKKRKPPPPSSSHHHHLPDDSDSDKEAAPPLCKKQRKRKKLKPPSKECSSSDEASKQPDDDPDMSFLLCEEKVPDDTSGSSSGGEEDNNRRMDLLPDVYPVDNVLDNTPPTTPSSTESLLSSSPSRDPYPVSGGYPESGESEGMFHCNRVMPARGSEEYRAAATLAFAVCKTVSEQQQAGKRPKGLDAATPSKRKKKRTQRYPPCDAGKSPKHKVAYPRVAKVENYCEDSSGTSPATSSSPPYGSLSSPSFSRSLPNRLAEGATSRYPYVPLHEKDPEKRISVLQDKMAALRKRYMALRAEVIAIDHKRRKARKKVREAAGISGGPSLHSEDGPSCS